MSDYPSYAVVPEHAFDDLHELARVLLCACGNSNDHDIERLQLMLEQVKERWSREAVAPVEAALGKVTRQRDESDAAINYFAEGNYYAGDETPDEKRWISEALGRRRAAQEEKLRNLNN